MTDEPQIPEKEEGEEEKAPAEKKPIDPTEERIKRINEAADRLEQAEKRLMEREEVRSAGKSPHSQFARPSTWALAQSFVPLHLGCCISRLPIPLHTETGLTQVPGAFEGITSPLPGHASQTERWAFVCSGSQGMSHDCLAVDSISHLDVLVKRQLQKSNNEGNDCGLIFLAFPVTLHHGVGVGQSQRLARTRDKEVIAIRVWPLRRQVLA